VESTDYFCRACGSSNVVELDARMKLTSVPSDGVKKFPVSESGPLLVCLDCGFARLKLSEAALQLLREEPIKP